MVILSTAKNADVFDKFVAVDNIICLDGCACVFDIQCNRLTVPNENHFQFDVLLMTFYGYARLRKLSRKNFTPCPIDPEIWKNLKN